MKTAYSGLGWVSKYLRVLLSADRKMEVEDGQAVSSISSNVCDVVERQGNELGKALNWQGDLPSNPPLWWWALGSDQINAIADTSS